MLIPCVHGHRRTLVETEIASVTPIGQLTFKGGLAALFDGVEDVWSDAAAARTLGQAKSAWAGQDFGAGNEKSVSKVVVFTQQFNNFDRGDNIRIILQRSDNASTWTDCGSITGRPSDSATIRAETVVSTDSTPARYWRAYMDFDGLEVTDYWWANEINFYELI